VTGYGGSIRVDGAGNLYLLQAGVPKDFPAPPGFEKDEAFRQAIGNVRAFHEHQRETDWQISLADGATVGQRIRAVAAAGLYVPGGRAAYPSSVLMNAVPAQVAGVRNP